MAKQKEQDNRQKKWAKFTYTTKETRQVTKMFRNTNVNVAYMTKNNVEKLLKAQNTDNPTNMEKIEYTYLSAPYATRNIQVRPAVHSM